MGNHGVQSKNGNAMIGWDGGRKEMVNYFMVFMLIVVVLKMKETLTFDKFNLPMTISPTQSIIIRDILPSQKEEIDSIFKDHGITPLDQVDPLARLAMACPALPLCGLAQTEAESIMPENISRIRALLDKLDLSDEEILIRMTGCPNGCARPYMAELAFVGDGPKSYQVWVGGSPV